MSDKGKMNDKVGEALKENANNARVAAAKLSELAASAAKDLVRTRRRKATGMAILRTVALAILWALVWLAADAGLLDARLGATVVGGATTLWAFYMGAWVQSRWGWV